MVLPAGYSLRPPRPAELDTALALLNEEPEALSGRSPATADWLSEIWFGPNTDLERDVAVVVDADGVMVGTLSVESSPPYTSIQAVGVVAIAHHGRGLGAAVVAETERRAQRYADLAPAGGRVMLEAVTIPDEPRVAELLRTLGYVEVSRTYVALVAFDGAPPAPPVVDGIVIRAIQPGQERAVYDCLTEGFIGAWDGSGWPSWEVFRHRYIESRPFDPSLWLVAWDGDVVVGALVGRAEIQDHPLHGWISLLAVRPRARGRGVGELLTLNAFGIFHDRGRVGVGLSVTHSEPTAAVRLYQRLGMEFTPEVASWEKELRAGA